MDVTDEYAENAFHWTRDSGNIEADAVWNAAHAGMKSVTFAAADIDGDVKISCTLTGNGATYGTVSVDDDLDASHTPGELDANDVFVIEDGYLKVTTSRGNVYALEDGKVKGAGAKLKGSITAESKLFASQPEDIVEFSYDHNGLRTQKKVTRADGTVETTDYVLHGKLLTHLTRGSDTMHFFYDNEKRPATVEFNGTLYGYVHNLQGDIVGIVDSNGNLVVEYKYDAWGKPVTTQTLSNSYEVLAELNPFRYRGYVWDKEIDMYYLETRYYAADRNRFINMDCILGVYDLLISNLYCYCKNNAVNSADPRGMFFEMLESLMEIWKNRIKRWKDEWENRMSTAEEYKERVPSGAELACILPGQEYYSESDKATAEFYSGLFVSLLLLPLNNLIPQKYSLPVTIMSSLTSAVATGETTPPVGGYFTITYVYSRTTTIVDPYSLDNETITYTDYWWFKEYINAEENIYVDSGYIRIGENGEIMP